MKHKTYMGLDIGRRDFIRFGSLSVAGLALNRLLASRLGAEEAPGPQNPKAKAVIQIFLAGGPCHIDMFDPKPNAPREFTGPYNRLAPTNVDGIALSQTMPLTAKCADKYSVIRGMTHGDNSHEVSTYMMLSGVPAGGELVYPAVGSIIAYKRRGLPQAEVPPFISVMDPYSRFDEAGFIGEAGRSFSASGIISRSELDFRPAAQPEPQADDENLTPKEKAALERAAKSPKARAERTAAEKAAKASESRQARERRRKELAKAAEFSNRRELLASIDTLRESITDEMAGIDPQRQMAYSMIVGKGREAFDLSREPDRVREEYGAVRQFGQQLLLARRLVEAGASFVNVMLHGWDTHKKHFEAMATLLPALDKAYAALIKDLDQRGLLETTVVTLGGEFGRTPRVMNEAPWMGGRNHFGAAFSWLVAGGGFKGGNLVGKTDATGDRVIERPVYPWDLSESVYTLAGVDAGSTLPHPTGCVAYVIPPEVKRRASGGILKEIMRA